MSKTNTTKSVNIIGMHCASCASTIKRKLGKIEGVEASEVNFGTETAKVTFDPEKTSLQVMNHEIGKYGYSLEEPHQEMNHPMDHSMHEGHDMMTPISSDASIKERKLQELAKLKNQVRV